MTLTTKAALADELGITRARISQYVKSGMPVRGDGKLDRAVALNWIKQTQRGQTFADKGANRARKLAVETRDRRIPPRLRGEASDILEWPLAFRGGIALVDDPADKLIVMTAMHMAYEAPAHAATMAVHAGASVATAYRLKSLLAICMMGVADRALADLGMAPFDGGAELDWVEKSF